MRLRVGTGGRPVGPRASRLGAILRCGLEVVEGAAPLPPRPGKLPPKPGIQTFAVAAASLGARYTSLGARYTSLGAR